MSAVKLLENLQGMLAQDKASVLLVHAKLKPSALVIMEGDTFPDRKHPTHVATKLLSTIDTIFSKLELSYVKTTEVMGAIRGRGYVEVIRFFVARDPLVAKRLKLLFDDTSMNHAEIGKLLGYPETAIAAFLTPHMLDMDNTPTSTEEVSERNMRLLGHRLSKDNWREEVKYLQESGEYIKSVSPLIYDEVTQEE